MRNNSKKTLRYAFWLGAAPILFVTAMVSIAVVMAVKGKSAPAPPKQPAKVDTVYVEKKVIEYRDTEPKRSTYVAPKPQPAKPAEPQPIDTTSN